MLKTMLFSGPSGSGSWVATLSGTVGATFQGNSFDSAISSDGSIYNISRYKTGNGIDGLRLVKYAPSGRVVWQKTILSETKNILCRSVDVDIFGYVYICGAVSGSASFVMKFDASGTDVWKKFFGGDSYEFLNSVCTDLDGNIFVGGETNESRSGDLFLVKFSNSGSLLWRTALGSKDSYGEYRYDSIKHIAVDNGGSVYAFGRTDGELGNTLLKFSSSSSLEWMKVIADSEINSGEKNLSSSPDGSVYLNFYIVTSENVQFVSSKFSDTGKVLWRKKLVSNRKNIRGVGSAAASDGSLYVCGYAEDPYPAAENGHAFLVKYDSSGSLQWQKEFAGVGIDRAYSVKVSSNGTVYFSGYTNSTGSNCSFVARLTEDVLSKNEAVNFGPFSLYPSDFTYRNASFTIGAAGLTISTPTNTLTSVKHIIEDGQFTSTLYKES